MISQLAHRPRQSQGGYIMVTAMTLVAVLLGVGLAFMRWSTDEAIQSRHVSGAIQAYYLAQMGVVEQGFMWLKSRDAGDLPIGVVTLPDKDIPSVGKYTEVQIYPPAGQGEGSFWTQQRIYRISAVGVVKAPWNGENNGDVDKEIRRKAVLYVSIRNFADYMYLSDFELTEFGDRIRFWGQDTLDGRVHSNSQIAIMQNPVFYDIVSHGADDFEHGPGYNPEFHIPPVHNAIPVLIPEFAENLRENADRYEAPGDNKQQRMVISGSDVTLYTWDLGEAFDSTEATATNFPITGTIEDGFCFFTETPLELKGVNITGSITIGSASLIRLIDDVRVAGPFEPTTQPGDYRVSYENTNYVGLVSEGDIKIANTPANGREDSNFQGPNQSNQNLTDIVITAAVVALGKHQEESGFVGSFTFENQNMADSGYVCTSCGCTPQPGGSPNPNCGTGGRDERGTIWLFGSLTQRRRGYVHRSCCTGTGYDKQYRYDTRFLRNRPPCFFDAVDSTGHALFNIVQWGQGQESQSDIARGVRVRYN